MNFAVALVGAQLEHRKRRLHAQRRDILTVVVSVVEVGMGWVVLVEGLVDAAAVAVKTRVGGSTRTALPIRTDLDGRRDTTIDWTEWESERERLVWSLGLAGNSTTDRTDIAHLHVAVSGGGGDVGGDTGRIAVRGGEIRPGSLESGGGDFGGAGEGDGRWWTNLRLPVVGDAAMVSVSTISLRSEAVRSYLAALANGVVTSERLAKGVVGGRVISALQPKVTPLLYPSVSFHLVSVLVRVVPVVFRAGPAECLLLAPDLTPVGVPSLSAVLHHGTGTRFRHCAGCWWCYGRSK